MIALAAATGVLYDHISTFDDEVELVWQRPKWTLVQLLFLVNRYVGDVMQVFGAIVYITHIQKHTHACCNVLNKLVGYLVMVVLASMQGIMIYRVSSMYSHNRKVIYFLGAALLVEIASVFFVQFYAYAFNAPVPDPAPGVHLCSQNTWPNFMWAAWIPIFFFEFCIFTLSVSLAVKYYKSSRTLCAARQASSI
ncbi:hypothetical protein CPB84DRAFT_1761763, partial [Gymnopilus junonius]